MSQYLRLTTLASVIAFAAACGSDNGNGLTPDAGDTPTADAGPDAPDAEAGPDDTATVLSVGASGDVGIVSTVGIPSLEVTQNAVDSVADADTLVRRIGDRLYLLNRRQDNLTIVDTNLQLVEQVSLGGGANPWDAAVVGDQIFVAGYGTEGILVLDATDLSAGVIETIDLSELESETNEPNCSALHLHGDSLLAACQILDANFAPTGAGIIAVIDPTDFSFDTFELAHENPSTRFALSPAGGALGGDALIATSGDLSSGVDLSAGCIERISLNGEPASEGCILDNEDLGGYAGALEIVGDTLWIVGFRADFSSFVASYDLVAGELAEPLTGDDISPTDLAICPDGELVIADNDFSGARGLRVYRDGEEVTDDLLDTGADPAFANGLVCY